MKKQKSLLMLKLDGLTIKLTYENGRLIGEASTEDDGDEEGRNRYPQCFGFPEYSFIYSLPETSCYKWRSIYPHS